jgi:hypothetical protein
MKNFFSKRINVIGVILLITVVTFGFKQVVVLDKVTVCHVPPGNPGNCQEISVSLNALDAHLDHGDNLVCHDQDEEEEYRRILRDRQPYSFNVLTLAY